MYFMGEDEKQMIQGEAVTKSRLEREREQVLDTAIRSRQYIYNCIYMNIFIEALQYRQ